MYVFRALWGCGRRLRGQILKFCFRWPSGAPELIFLDPKQTPGLWILQIVELRRLYLGWIFISEVGGKSNREIGFGSVARTHTQLWLGFETGLVILGRSGVPLVVVQMNVDEMIHKVVLRDRGASVVMLELSWSVLDEFWCDSVVLV